MKVRRSWQCKRAVAYRTYHIGVPKAVGVGGAKRRDDEAESGRAGRVDAGNLRCRGPLRRALYAASEQGAVLRPRLAPPNDDDSTEPARHAESI